jgi:hypothetical protein
LTVALACGAGALLIPAGKPEAQMGDCKDATERRGTTGVWSRIGQPGWPEGPDGIVTHAVDPENGTWYITNGIVVQVSKDDGCHFEPVYTLDDARTDSPALGKSTALIDSLAANAGIIAVSIASPTVDGSRPAAGATHVAISEDMGASWGVAVPLTGAGEPGPIVISRSNPSVIYAAAGKVLNRSDDAGATFTPLTGIVLADPASLGYPEIAVDPSDEDTVFVRSTIGISRTTDGGESWDNPVSDQVSAGPGAASAGGPARVVATTAGADGFVNGWFESRDGGESFQPRTEADFGEIAGTATGAAFGGLDEEDLIVTSIGVRGGPDPAVHRWYPKNQRFMDFDEFSWGPMRGATASNDGFTVHFHSGGRLFTWELPSCGLDCVDPPPPRNLPFEFFEPPPPPKARPAKLKPGEGDIVIPVGGSTTVKYSLEVPAQPTRLDTFFLLDSSGSTGGYIDGLKIGIGRLIRELLRGYTDSNFGLGEYQDTGFTSDSTRDADDDAGDTAMQCGVANTVRYRRRADIRPPDQSFQKPLDAMEPCGGNEPGYTAAHQVATGAGVLEPRYGPRVKPGRGATWRDDTMRILFHVADEPFYPDPDGANRQQTIDALKARNMKFIGVDMSANGGSVTVSSNGSTTTAPGTNLGGGKVDCTQYPSAEETQSEQRYGETPVYCYLADIARETGTLAPRGGVDCTGDGKADVLEGEPLVCAIAQSADGGGSGVIEMADPVRELLLAIPDVQPVTFTQEGLAEVGVGIKALDDLNVDVHGDHDLEFEVTLSCNAAQAQKAFPVRFRSTLKGHLIARAKARAICGSLPAAPAPPVAESPSDPPLQTKTAKKVAPDTPPVDKPPAPVAVAPPIAPPAFAVAAAPPPPPAPVSNPAPAQAPASAPGSASAPAAAQAMVPAAALAKSPTEVQAQRIHDDPTKDEGKSELKFSRYTSEESAEAQAELLFSGGEDPGNGAWLFRMLGTTALLASAVAFAPRRRRQRQIRRAHIR